ncbi:MAG: ATP-binding cassette domain-containing protein, partial [Candidatus Lokiarchaeota archaeon]|nr:ATP-binding cassette domain-containing protein [Candidatus Lokiarchaeota archaeon]
SLSIAFLLPLGLYLYFQGSLTLSILLFFIIITPSFFNSLANYLYGYMHVKSSIGLAMAHILEVLNKKTIHEPEKDMELKNFNIEFENVFFRYDKEPVLKGIGFEIPEKSITAFVGPSGAGKTTIANLIARFWDIDSGVIRIGGQNIQELKLDRLLSYISIVFQEVILFNDTIMENIRLGRKDATYKEIISAAKAAKCDGFTNSLPNGYNTIIGERGVKLSEGEKQRISIARALLKNAPILLLDEATVFIDPENEKMIQSAVSELIKNKTVLIIAHRLSTITSADQILVLDRGRILEKGNHEELLAANNLYCRFWEAHKAARKWKI